MLRLDQTALLLDALRPPRGMEIDVAVGTTFTLDLTALLTIPVAAGFEDITDASAPADLLETIRSYAERTVLFCQAGAVSVPSQYRSAHTLVEDTVVEVAKPDGGIFHPKVWIVRFAGEGSHLHRVLVMSRNLTFDKAWDVIVRLDEDPEATHVMESQGILDFLESLPRSAARELLPRQREQIDSLLSTLADARLAVPTPFTQGRFVPVIDGFRRRPFRSRYDAALAVSPFLTDDALRSFFKPSAKRKVIVSRAAALNAHASFLRDLGEVYRVKDALLDAQEDLEAFTTYGDDPESDLSASTETVVLPSMRGLHAKFYVQDHGESATAWLGSANLTGGAFGANVEILVELTGARIHVGVDAVIDKKGRRDDLSWIVEPHTLPEVDEMIEDSEEGISEIEACAYEVASHAFTIAYSFDSDLGSDPWSAELVVSSVATSPDLRITARPLSVGPGRAVPISEGRAAWSGLLEEEITPFVVLTLKTKSATRNVLVRADIEGDPPNRRRSVIAQAIKSPEDFLRYLAALLGLAGSQGNRGGGGGEGMFDGWIADIHIDRVLEDLLTTASRNPTRLDSLDDTLSALKQDGRFGDVVPPAFSDLWTAVYEARKDEIG